MMDDFGDEIAGMDPQGRCIREPGYGTEFARQMLDDASGSGGIVLVAEDNGRIVGFASGRIDTRAERERLAVIDFRNGDRARAVRLARLATPRRGTRPTRATRSALPRAGLPSVCDRGLRAER